MRGSMPPDLNPPQREAVHTLTGPLLVLAGAGTGKTRVVTYRIAELIKRGARPAQILAVTFTNKAAAEMQERAAGLLGKRKKGQEKPEISTFHSLCVRILRRHITGWAIRRSSPFTTGAIRKPSPARPCETFACPTRCCGPATC